MGFVFKWLVVRVLFEIANIVEPMPDDNLTWFMIKVFPWIVAGVDEVIDIAKRR